MGNSLEKLGTHRATAITSNDVAGARNAMLEDVRMTREALGLLTGAKVCACLRKFDGKQINKRLFDALSRALGDEPKDYQSGYHSYGDHVDFDTGHGYAWTDCNRRRSSLVKLSYKHDRRDSYGVDMTLICAKDENGGELSKVLDAEATISDMVARAENWERGLKHDERAASVLAGAAMRWNRIGEAARDLLEYCKQIDGEGEYNGCITVLCALGREVYESVNKFRYGVEVVGGKGAR